MEKITLDTFTRAEIKIGAILSAEAISGSEKLLKLSVDFGEESPRQILSGIAKYFPQGDGLVGRKCAFITNLEPRTMMGLESQGMLLATSGIVDGKEFLSVLHVDEIVPPGSLIK